MAQRYTVRAYNLNIYSDLELDLPHKEGQADLNIIRQNFVYPKTEKTKIFRAGQQAEYVCDKNAHYFLWPNLVEFKITKTHIYYRELIAHLPIGLLRVFILSEALGTVLFLRGYVLLHASAAVVDNRVEVFAGTPGVGKSTRVAALAKYDHIILSDDIVAIDINQDGYPEVVPSFPEIKIWADTAQTLNFDLKTLKPAWEGKNKFILKTTSLPDKMHLLGKLNILEDTSENDSSKKHTLEEKYLIFIKYFPLAHQLINSNTHKNYFNKVILILNYIEILTLKRPKTIEELEDNIKELAL